MKIYIFYNNHAYSYACLYKDLVENEAASFASLVTEYHTKEKENYIAQLVGFFSF